MQPFDNVATSTPLLSTPFALHHNTICMRLQGAALLENEQTPLLAPSHGDSSSSSSTQSTRSPTNMAGKQDTDKIRASEDGASIDIPGVVESPVAKRVLRKIDLRLLPLLFITYNFNFMDKTILSSASVFGLKDSTVRNKFTLSI